MTEDRPSDKSLQKSWLVIYQNTSTKQSHKSSYQSCVGCDGASLCTEAETDRLGNNNNIVIEQV